MINKIKQWFRSPKIIEGIENFDEAKEHDIIKLNKKYNQVDLIREQLKGISVDFNGMIVGKNDDGTLIYKDITDEMTEEDKRAFLEDTKRLDTNTLKTIVEYLVNIQGNISMREAQNENQRYFGLATINGIELLHDTIKALSLESEPEKVEKMEDGEERDII